MPRRKEVEREADAPAKIHWPEHLAKLLGRMSDSKLARRAGVHVSTVAAERRRRGIGPYLPCRPPIEWTEEMIARLGQATDRQVADELGVGVGSVFYKRTVLGIPPYCPPAFEGSPFWTSERVALLGRIPDNQLAARWRISSSAVAYWRCKLGIPPKRPRPGPVEWTASMRSWLGREPDRKVAERLGVSSRAVRKERARLGIPPARPVRRKVVRSPALRPTLARPTEQVVTETGVSTSTVQKLRRELDVAAPPRPSAWTEDALAKLGRVPDTVLAAELGLKPATVQRKRQKAGIVKRRARRWTQEEDELVRTLSPQEAAERTGRTSRAVDHRRKTLGLPPPPTQSRLRWTPEVVDLLGKVPDSQLARRLGITRAAVMQKRRRLGIPAHEKAATTAPQPPSP